MNRTLPFLVAFAVFIGWSQTASAQIIALSSFNPSDAGSLCGVGLDPETESVWVYECSAGDIQSYSTDGTFITSVPRPGESANDIDVEFAPEEFTLNDSTLPQGTLLFINGESGPAEIYAVDKATGSVIDTLKTSFGNSHVVGGAYHPLRNSFFLIQDNVPGPADENRIAEVDPVSGDTLSTFQITSTFSVFYGDMEVSSSTGSLFIVSSAESSMAEFTPDGDLVALHALPTEVSSLSGIALNCAANEAWVVNTDGVVWHLGQIPCGSTTSVEEDMPLTFRLSVAYPNPFTTRTSFLLEVERPQRARVAVYDVLGREVALLHSGVVGAGEWTFTFDGSNLPSALYIVRADGETFSAARHVILAK